VRDDWPRTKGERVKNAVESNHARRSTPQTLKIGEVAKLGDVGIETLRFYERQGLIDRPARTESGYRLYDRTVLEQIEFIKRAQTLGFSLAEIARIIAERRAGGSPCLEVRQIVRERLRELDARLVELERYRAELASTLEEWDALGDTPGHVCGLIEGARIDAPAVTGQSIVRRKRR